MMEELGLPFGGVDEIKSWVGDGHERLIHRIITRHLDGEVSENVYNIANPIFHRALRSRQYQNTQLYPDVAACLERLESMEIPRACVTNKNTAQAYEVLDHLGIRHYFTVVLGQDSVAEPKPSPDGIFEAAEHMKVDAINVLMVGDSVNDVRAARAAGSSVVAVSYGYNYGIDISSANPDSVINNLASIPKMIA
ncbi:HAD-IA family hydrolase [Enterovibrio coralii]|nr:HAD-IA family hydrolase [Enterovibrio coralii]